MHFIDSYGLMIWFKICGYTQRFQFGFFGRQLARVMSPKLSYLILYIAVSKRQQRRLSLVAEWNRLLIILWISINESVSACYMYLRCRSHQSVKIGVVWTAYTQWWYDWEEFFDVMLCAEWRSYKDWRHWSFFLFEGVSLVFEIVRRIISCRMSVSFAHVSLEMLLFSFISGLPSYEISVRIGWGWSLDAIVRLWGWIYHFR